MQFGKIGINTLAQVLGKIIGAGGMFVVSLLLARSFGASGFGDFTKITTYIAFYYLLADFGLNAVYLQQIKTQEKKLWPNLLVIRFLGSLILIILALIILALLPKGTTQGYTPLVRFGIILFSPAILFQALITTTNALFQKHLRYGLATVAITVGTLVSVILVWLATQFVKADMGSVFGSLGLLLGAGTTAAAALILIRNLDEPLEWSVKPALLRKLFVASIPLGLMLLFNQVYFRFDSFVLTLTRSTAEVGIYGLAYKFFEVPLVVPTFFMNAVYPLLLTSDRRKFRKLLTQGFWILLSGGGLALIGLWYAAPLLSLIRPEFSASIAVLRILVLGLPFFFLTSLLLWALVALEKQKLLPLIYGASMLLIIILDILFIPRFGYPAAAWITVVTEGIVLFMLFFVLAKEILAKKYL